MTEDLCYNDTARFSGEAYCTRLDRSLEDLLCRPRGMRRRRTFFGSGYETLPGYRKGLDMLNEEKIKAMNRLALYEKKEGKKYFPISKYFRSDYVGQALIRNLFLVTIGYLLLMALVAMYNTDFLMENIHKMDLKKLAFYLIAGYGIILGAYTFLTFILYNVKYYLAKKSVRKYYEQLTKVEKMYQYEDKMLQSHSRSGGKR